MRSIAIITAVSLSTIPAVAQDPAIESEAGPIRVVTVAEGLEWPWGLTFLPDGRMLLTEQPGRLRIVDRDGEISEPVEGVPAVFYEDQGGLLDVALDPEFANTRFVYLSFSEAGDGGASTAVARGRLTEDGRRLEGTETIFRQEPKVSGGKHFGSRLVFGPDGKLFVTLGERFKFDPAQDLSGHLGKIVRIYSDGSVPPDNPFVGNQNAREETWSYGHRNVEAAAIHPETGQLWVAEMGPRDGDELNIIEPGGNYGWPLVSWGRHYDGRDIPDPPTRPEFVQPVHQWTPVISPSGMIFYTADSLADWRGDVLVGGLSARGLVRVDLDGDSVVGEERLELGARIRDVAAGPDGAVYVLTDRADGAVLRLSPADSR